MPIALVPWTTTHAEPLAAMMELDVVRYLGRSVPYPYDLDDARA
jgi:hypothetical protein